MTLTTERKMRGRGESLPLTTNSTSLNTSDIDLTTGLLFDAGLPTSEPSENVFFVDFFGNGAPDLPAAYSDIRDLVAQDEQDPARSAELAEARALLADVYYAEDKTISAMRLRKGLSQTQLAELVGTSQPHIARIEGGNTEPLASTVKRLAEALGSTVQEVIDAVT